jgi:hypothetical protein
MAPKKKTKPLRDRITQQAQTEASLKYAPQRRQLSAQQQDIVDQFATGAKVAQATGKGIAEQINTVRPQVAGYVGKAQNLVDQGQSDLARYLGSSPLQGAATIDATNTKGRLAETLANTNTELDRRKIDAAAGTQYTVNALRTSAADALKKVGGQLSDLASDQGSYAATTSDRLRQQAASRAVTRRGQDLSHQDRVAAIQQRQQAADAKKKDKQRGLLSAKDQQKAQDDIAKAVAHAQDLVKAGNTRQQIANILVQGRSGASVTDPATGQKLPLPDRPALPRDYVLAALDVVFDKHISLQKQQALQRRGIRVKDLGYTTSGQYRRTHAAAPNAATIGRR